jgi:hypothetical protein
VRAGSIAGDDCDAVPASLQLRRHAQGVYRWPAAAPIESVNGMDDAQVCPTVNTSPCCRKRPGATPTLRRGTFEGQGQSLRGGRGR